MDPKPRSPGLDDLPDVPLLKIIGFLNCNSLLAVSQTTSTLFRNLSSNEHLWRQKLAQEYFNADLSPKFLEKADSLKDAFPVSCHSKRLLLLRKRINKNLRTGSLSPAGQRCIQGPTMRDQVILNDEHIIIVNAKKMTFSIDVFKMPTRQWTTLDLSSYFLEDSIYDDRNYVNGNPYTTAIEERTATFLNIAIFGSSVALLAQRSGNCRRKILFFIDLAGLEPRLIRRVNFSFYDYSYLFGTTKLYKKDASHSTKSLKEIDLKTGNTIREVHINDFECLIKDEPLSNENLLRYVVNQRNETKTPRLCDLMTGVSTILTEDPGIFFAYFHPEGTNPRPVLYGEQKYDPWSSWGRPVKKWTVAKSYGSNYFALYSEKPAIDEQVLVYEVVECDTERQILKLNSTIVMLGNSSNENRLEKVEDRGSIEIRFFQELIGKEMRDIDLRQDGHRQSVVIINDIIIRIRSPLEAGSALLDFTDIKTGEVLREMNFTCDGCASVALIACSSTIIAFIKDEIMIFDLVCDNKQDDSGFSRLELTRFVSKAKDWVPKLFHRK